LEAKSCALNTAAGSDGVLTRDEFNQVNVTRTCRRRSTPLLNRRQRRHARPRHDRTLLPLVQNIDLDQMLELAAIIKLVVDEGVPLPTAAPTCCRW
jgi:hypothetical protein